MEKLDNSLRTTREVKHAAADAIEDYLIYQNIGSNAPLEEHAYEWVESISATTAAAKRAENLIQEQIQEQKEADAKKKQQNSKKR